MGGRRGERGQAIVIIALIFAVLCGMLALAIDGGRGFVTKRQLQNAADASASAAARTFSRSSQNWVTAETAQLSQYAKNRDLTADPSRCSPSFAAPTSNHSVYSVCSFADDSTQFFELLDTNMQAPLALDKFQSQGYQNLSTLFIQVLGGGPTFGVYAAGMDWHGEGGGRTGPPGRIDPPCVNNQCGSNDNNGGGPQECITNCDGHDNTNPGDTPPGWVGPWPPCVNGCSGTSYPVLTSPVVLSLSTGCASGSDSMTLSGQTGQAAVIGNVVSWGDIALSTGAVPVGGETSWTCGNAPYPGALKPYCYPSGAAPDSNSHCSGSDTPTTAFQGGQPSGPNFTAAQVNSTSQSLTALNVNLSPGIYGSPLQLGMGTYQNGCWFLPGGVYQFQTQFNDESGITSNELRPPDEPVPGSITTRASTQFWRQNSSSCDGGFAITGVADVGGVALAAGAYAIRITSVRTDNGVTRQSAPSMCRSLNLATPSALAISISNVPGASDYYVYLSSALLGAGGGTCASGSSKFYYAADLPTPSLALETNANTSGCPSTVSIATCSLGVTVGSVDQAAVNTILTNIGLNTAVTLAGVPELTSPAGSGLPDQDPAVGSDTANWGFYKTSGSSGCTGEPSAPNTSAGYSPPCWVTPGAVQIQSTTAGCINFAPPTAGTTTPGPLPFLYSGYQYAWALALQQTNPSACSDYFEPVAGGRLFGHVDVPAATGYVWAQSSAVPTVYGTFTANQVVLDGSNGVAVMFVPPPTNSSYYGTCVYC